MKKQKKRVLIIFCIALFFLSGCDNLHDSVSVRNRTTWKMDNIIIEAPEGYFYQQHEKNRVDDNTIALTIYFSKESDEGSW